MQVKFSADKVKVLGPKVDGGYTVSFNVGEYMQEQIAQLVLVPQNNEIEVEVNVGE